MSDLIKREDAIREMFRFKGYIGFDEDMLYRIEYALNQIPTIPAPRWHRVEDELPVKGEIVIVSDGKRTWDVGQYHCLVSSDDRTKWWWKGHTIKTVKWWMRKKDALPEPPKEDA